MTDHIRHAEVNGVRLAYQVHAATQGLPPLLFVHGYAMRATGGIYGGLIERLASRYQVHALDLRGHGGSAEAGGGGSLVAWADDVAAFAKAAGISGCVYLGHSIGAFTGIHAAIRHPEAFSALCLLTPAAAVGGRTNPPGIEDLFVASGRDRAAMREAFAPMYLRPTARDLELAVDSVTLMPASVHQTFFPAFRDCVLTDRLSEVRIPALVVNGLGDTVVPPNEQHLTAIGLPFVKEVNLSNQGHMLPIEASALAAREVLDFCRDDLGLWR